MAFGLLQQALQGVLGLLRGDARQQGGKAVVGKARQLGTVAEVLAQQAGAVGQQQVAIGHADLAEQAGMAVDAHDGQGGGTAIAHGPFAGLVEQFEEVHAVVQAGDQVLAADLAQLLRQFGIVAFRADHHLGAGLAVIGGRREGHPCAELAAVVAHAATQQLGVLLAVLVGLEEVLERALITALDQVDHRHAGDIVGVAVAEQFDVGAVDVDVHAVVDVGDGVHRAVEEQLAALFRFAQRHLGGAPGAAFLEVLQFALGHQQQAFVVGLRHAILGAEQHGFGDRLAVAVGHPLQERQVLTLAANGAEGFAGFEVFAVLGGNQQVPGLLQGVGQVGAGGQPVGAGGMAGVAEQADQSLGLVLRVLEEQQADGFLFGGHGWPETSARRAQERDS
ncbi:hypothetical protein D9M71_210690 [compost metagenome]